MVNHNSSATETSNVDATKLEDTTLPAYFVELGDAEKITKMYADGGNKDGGYISGHNWAFN